MSRSRLYELRTDWLKNQSGYQPAASGGDHGEAWPAEVIEFLIRKVHLRHIIQFDGLDYEISPTSRKSVTVLFHPRRKLWVLEHSLNLTWPPILGQFTL